MAGTSYTRQSSFSDGDTISASLFNNEYNRLVNAFSYASSGTTGHRHDGTSGEGGNIHTIGDQDFLNKIVVDSTNNRWGFFVQVSSSAVEQIRIQDGAIVPVQDNDIDLGTSSLEFKDGYFDGTLYADAINFNGTAISATAAELNILDGVTATAAELNYSDTGSSVGTVVASKVVTVDSNKDVSSFRNITLTGELDAGSLDISGDVDIDGTTNLDVVDIDGAVDMASTLVVGDIARLNSKLYLYTTDDQANYYALYTHIDDSFRINYNNTGSDEVIMDTSGNMTILGSLTATELDISGNVDIDGTLETDALSINGTSVTATAAELNILDGVTSTAAELNILDGVTSTTAELNILDGVTSTTAELNILDGVTATTAELNILDGVTVTAAEINTLDGITAVLSELNALDLGSTAIGTAIASKAVILDSNKDYTGIRNFTITGELDAATLDISGDVDIDGTTNLDVVDIDGAVNMASTLTSGTDVGVNSEYAVLGDDTSSRQLKFTQYQTSGSYDNAGHKINASSGYGELALAVGGTNALTLNASQKATFAGNVDVEGSAGIYQRNSSGGSIVLDDTDTADGSTPMVYLRNTAGELTLGRANRNASTGLTTGSTDSLTISSTGDATFAGNVGVSSGAISLGSTDVALQVGSSSHSTPTIQIRSGTSGTGKLWFGDNSGTDAGRYDGYIQYYHGDGTSNTREMRFGTEGTLALTLDSSQNATFPGEVAAASLDISGNVDVDGTL